MRKSFLPPYLRGTSALYRRRLLWEVVRMELFFNGLIDAFLLVDGLVAVIDTVFLGQELLVA